MKALLLSAGFGKRLLPITQFCPKPALPLLNIPLGFYSLFLLKQVGVTDLVVNLHHLHEIIKTTFKPLSSSFQTLSFSDETNQILDSGGGIKKAQSLIELQSDSSDFWVVNTDMVILPENQNILSQMLDNHRQCGRLATYLVTSPQPNPVSQIWADKNNFFINFGPQPPKSKHDLLGWQFAGIALYSKEIFSWLPSPSQPAHIFRDALLPALNQGQCASLFPFKGFWQSCETQKDYLELTMKLAQFYSNHPLYRSFLDKTLALNPNLKISYDSENFFLQDKDCKISPQANRIGTVILGKNVTLGPQCSIENCLVWNEKSLSSGVYKNEIIY